MFLRMLILLKSSRWSYSNKIVVKILYKYSLKLQPGTFELLILLLIFIGLQAWWVIPIIKRNNKMNEKNKDIKDDIKKLERIFKK